MEPEELNIIMEKIENPPKGIKVEKSSKNMTVQINIQNIWMSMILLFSLFAILVLIGIFIFGFLLDFGDWNT